MPFNPDYAIYCVRTHGFIDTFGDKAAAETALKGYQASYGPNLAVLAMDVATDIHAAAHRSDPVEITQAQWQDAFDVLPPMGWRRDHLGESFKMAEMLTAAAAITTIFVMAEGRAFRFNDSLRLSHPECCERVRGSKAFAGVDLSDDAGRA